MGSIPYRMCDICKKRLGVQSVLGARRQNLSRLRVEKLGCAGAGSRQVDVEVGTYRSPTKAGAVGRHTLQSSVVLVSFPFFSVTVLPALCCSSWAVSSLYLPKTALAALAGLCPFSVTVLPSSPACPWIYSPKTAFATLANLQSEDLTL